MRKRFEYDDWHVVLDKWTFIVVEMCHGWIFYNSSVKIVIQRYIWLFLRIFNKTPIIYSCKLRFYFTGCEV